MNLNVLSVIAYLKLLIIALNAEPPIIANITIKMTATISPHQYDLAKFLRFIFVSSKLKIIASIKPTRGIENKI